MEPAEITLRKWETIPEAFQTGLRKHVAVQGLPAKKTKKQKQTQTQKQKLSQPVGPELQCGGTWVPPNL